MMTCKGSKSIVRRKHLTPSGRKKTNTPPSCALVQKMTNNNNNAVTIEVLDTLADTTLFELLDFCGDHNIPPEVIRKANPKVKTTFEGIQLIAKYLNIPTSASQVCSFLSIN